MPNIKITLARNSDREIKTKQQLESLFKKYNLKKWFFTNSILIKAMEVPTSHPVLILNTIHLNDDDALLSTFLHEQIHWFVSEVDKNAKVFEAIKELKLIFPRIPQINSFMEDKNFSSYLHLIVNYLEYDGLRCLLNENRAREAINKKGKYVELYKIIIQQQDKIREILEKYNLII